MMAGSPLVPLAAGLCFVLSTVAYVRGLWIGDWLAAAGAAVLAGALVSRGVRAGHFPLTSQYEFALAFALAVILVAMPLFKEPGHRGFLRWEQVGKTGRASAIQAITLGLAAALVAYACLGLPAFRRTSQPLSPALDSIWLPLHVGSAALGYGALSIAGAAGLVGLVRGGDHAEAERVLSRAMAMGYPMLTVSIIFGMIWAQVAWGRYWGWDLKEVWTLITWLIYTLYWHLRQRPRWQGRRLSWLVLAGQAAVLFTFLGVGWLARTVGLESLHLF